MKIISCSSVLRYLSLLAHKQPAQELHKHFVYQSHDLHVYGAVFIVYNVHSMVYKALTFVSLFRLLLRLMLNVTVNVGTLSPFYERFTQN